MQPAAVPPSAAARPESLRERFLDIRTLVSFLIVAIVVAVAVTHAPIDYRSSLRAITQVNLFLYAAAFAAFYFSFVVRAARWEILLRNAGEHCPFRPLLPIILLAWFANCVLPAKMGDFYRAYLLRQRTPVSGSKGLGTILSERILDFLVLMSLLLLSGLVSFHLAVPARFRPALVAGVVLALLLIVGLVALRFVRGLSRLLPARLQERASHFRGGVVDAFQARIPVLIGLSVVVWFAESARLYLVVQALPLHVDLNPAQIVFIALVASLLTTIPALPGGLVLVEGGIIAVLVFFGLTTSQGFSVAILDRIISYWSLIVVGLLVFLFGRHPMRR
jgi:uncharacterized protein (TIRG00374 family)